MNTDSQSNQREQLEVRLVALLLGEASAFEESELKRIMEQDASLAGFYAEMQQAINLVKEASKQLPSDSKITGLPPAQPKLTPERRAALLESFKKPSGQKPGESSVVTAKKEELRETQRIVQLPPEVKGSPWYKLPLQLAALFLFLGLMAALLLPALSGSKDKSQKVAALNKERMAELEEKLVTEDGAALAAGGEPMQVGIDANGRKDLADGTVRSVTVQVAPAQEQFAGAYRFTQPVANAPAGARPKIAMPSGSSSEGRTVERLTEAVATASGSVSKTEKFSDDFVTANEDQAKTTDFYAQNGNAIFRGNLATLGRDFKPAGGSIVTSGGSTAVSDPTSAVRSKGVELGQKMNALAEETRQGGFAGGRAGRSAGRGGIGGGGFGGPQPAGTVASGYAVNQPESGPREVIAGDKLAVIDFDGDAVKLQKESDVKREQNVVLFDTDKPVDSFQYSFGAAKAEAKKDSMDAGALYFNDVADGKSKEAAKAKVGEVAGMGGLGAAAPQKTPALGDTPSLGFNFSVSSTIVTDNRASGRLEDRVDLYATQKEYAFTESDKSSPRPGGARSGGVTTRGGVAGQWFESSGLVAGKAVSGPAPATPTPPPAPPPATAAPVINITEVNDRPVAINSVVSYADQNQPISINEIAGVPLAPAMPSLSALAPAKPSQPTASVAAPATERFMRRAPARPAAEPSPKVTWDLEVAEENKTRLGMDLGRIESLKRTESRESSAAVVETLAKQRIETEQLGAIAAKPAEEKLAGLEKTESEDRKRLLITDNLSRLDSSARTLSEVRAKEAANRSSRERQMALAEKPVSVERLVTNTVRLNEAAHAPKLALALSDESKPVDVVKKLPSSPLLHQPDSVTRENRFSTFSLNVSDVAFKLAATSLDNGQLPDPNSVRTEEFINAFNYRDPAPAPGAKLGFAWERARYPFAHNRDILRFSIKTAALGREAQQPLNLVILLDNSGSMERPDRVQIVGEALKVLADKMQPQDKISVVAFSRTSRLCVDGMAGGKPQELLGRVLDLNPQGGTDIGNGLSTAYAAAVKHFMPKGNNRVILLTDGAANLGNVEPEELKKTVVEHRKKGIALDCFGIGWEGYNDDLLEVLCRNGDGRYSFLNNPEQANTEFAEKLAGSLSVAASDVKAQVEFNPQRVTVFRQIGYAKHQLKKEQFRDNTVDAAEIAASESGNALYVIEVNPQGTGPLGVVRARFKVPATGEYVEQEWTLSYSAAQTPDLQQAGPTMRLAVAAGAFGEYLAQNPYAGEINLSTLPNYLIGVPEHFSPDPRPKQLSMMIRQAIALAGK